VSRIRDEELRICLKLKERSGTFLKRIEGREEKTKDLYINSYIYLYNMKQTTILHSPTLESVIMVEKTIQKYSQECGRYQLWRKLPKKMMYQTFQVILDYLEESGKILIDKDGCIIWTYDPEGIKKLISKGVNLR
jgi:hypothetical protein